MSTKAAKKRYTSSSSSSGGIHVHPALLEQGNNNSGAGVIHDEDDEEQSEKYHSFSTLAKNNTFLFIAIVLCIFVPCLYVFTHPKTSSPTTPGNSELHRSIEEYNQLLQRATTLIKQYKSLTNADTIPENLMLAAPNEQELHSILQGEDPSRKQQNKKQVEPANEIEDVTKGEIDSSSGNNNPAIISRKSSKRDLVLGMAQDTDPKNLVRQYC